MSVVSEETRTLRSVEVAQQQEADSWALADAIYDDVDDLVEDQSSTADQVLGAALDEIYRQMREANIDIGRDYVMQLRQTRRAWPPEDRVPQASFTAHYLLRSKTYDGKRKTQLERMVARSGQVGAADVKRWISERRPPEQNTFLGLVEKRLRSATKSAVVQPWSTITQDDRESIAKILYTIAGEIEDGSFPPKAKT